MFCVIHYEKKARTGEDRKISSIFAFTRENDGALGISVLRRPARGLDAFMTWKTAVVVSSARVFPDGRFVEVVQSGEEERRVKLEASSTLYVVDGCPRSCPEDWDQLIFVMSLGQFIENESWTDTSRTRECQWWYPLPTASEMAEIRDASRMVNPAHFNEMHVLAGRRPRLCIRYDPEKFMNAATEVISRVDWREFTRKTLRELSGGPSADERGVRGFLFVADAPHGVGEQYEFHIGSEWLAEKIVEQLSTEEATPEEVMRVIAMVAKEANDGTQYEEAFKRGLRATSITLTRFKSREELVLRKVDEERVFHLRLDPAADDVWWKRIRDDDYQVLDSGSVPELEVGKAELWLTQARCPGVDALYRERVGLEEWRCVPIEVTMVAGSHVVRFDQVQRLWEIFHRFDACKKMELTQWIYAFPRPILHRDVSFGYLRLSPVVGAIPEWLRKYDGAPKAEQRAIFDAPWDVQTLERPAFDTAAVAMLADPNANAPDVAGGAAGPLSGVVADAASAVDAGLLARWISILERAPNPEDLVARWEEVA
jgi:hypothetical protein